MDVNNNLSKHLTYYLLKSLFATVLTAMCIRQYGQFGVFQGKNWKCHLFNISFIWVTVNTAGIYDYVNVS